MFEIGNSLREARIRRGLSLKEAEDATKIRAKYLQALEDDDFEVIPGPTFVRGFLRTYSEFLGLDANLVVDEYRSRYEPHQEMHYIARRPASRHRDRRPRRQSNLVMVGIVALAALILLYWAGWGRGGSTATLEPEALGTSSTSSVVALPAVEESSAVESAVDEDEQVDEETTTTLAQGVLTVQLTASRGRCWLLVKENSASGKVLYSGTMEKGASVSLDSAGSYWANVGSPSSLDLTLNGTPSTVPEPYGNFLISPAGVERLP